MRARIKKVNKDFFEIFEAFDLIIKASDCLP
jgi:hypothetical protein